MTTEQYQIGYEEGYQEGWNAAMGETPLYSALSAASAGWKLVPVEPTVDQEWAGKNAAMRCSTMGEACKIYKAMLAASPTPTAEQAAAKAAPVSSDTLHLLRRLLSNQHTLTGPEFRAELEKIVGEAYQQEAQEPSKAYAWVYVNKYGVESIPASKDWCTAMVSGHGGSMFPLYTAPQPAPAPLSDEVLKEVIQDSNRYRWLRRPLLHAGQGSIQVVMDDRLNGKIDRVIFLDELDKAIDAALAAQGDTP